MSKVKNGELSELTDLFERYHIPLYNFFLKLTLDKDTSEDLTQNLFYRIMRYRNTFNAETGTFKSWMYQMAKNLHVDYTKQKQRVREMEKPTDTYPENVTEVEGEFREHDFEKLKLALAGLEPPDRELIVLSRYEGFKYAEISKMKNRSLSSIKVQIHRAMKELRVLYFKQ